MIISRRLAICSLIVVLLFLSTNVYSISNLFGYTYYINKGMSNESVYNVMGRVTDLQYSGNYSAFETYAVRQSGDTISNFEDLKLHGRIWWQNAASCREKWRDVKYHWSINHPGNITGLQGVNILSLQNPTKIVYPQYAAGKHKIKHPNTVNVDNKKPSNFFVHSLDPLEVLNENRKPKWKGEGLVCD